MSLIPIIVTLTASSILCHSNARIKTGVKPGKGCGITEPIHQAKGDLEEALPCSFASVPLRVTLEPITELLTPLNFEPSDEYEIPSGINLTYLTELFEKGNSQYCSSILGLTDEQCTTELTGCGYTGYCAFGMLCMDDPSSPSKFTCGKHFLNADLCMLTFVASFSVSRQ